MSCWERANALALSGQPLMEDIIYLISCLQADQFVLLAIVSQVYLCDFATGTHS